jgi:hypothetical protein
MRSRSSGPSALPASLPPLLLPPALLAAARWRQYLYFHNSTASKLRVFFFPYL